MLKRFALQVLLSNLKLLCYFTIHNVVVQFIGFLFQSFQDGISTMLWYIKEKIKRAYPVSSLLQNNSMCRLSNKAGGGQGCHNHNQKHFCIESILKTTYIQIWFQLHYTKLKLFPTHYYNNCSFTTESQNRILNLKTACVLLFCCFSLPPLLAMFLSDFQLTLFLYACICSYIMLSLQNHLNFLKR